MNTAPIQVSGSVLVRTRTGYGIFPLENVLVTIFSEEGMDSTVVATGYTNSSGLSPEFVLPATVREGSTELKPIAKKFTIEAEKPGYQSVILHGIQIYPGVLTVQNINMAPLPEKQGLQLTAYDEELVKEDIAEAP